MQHDPAHGKGEEGHRPPPRIHTNLLQARIGQRRKKGRLRTARRCAASWIRTTSPDTKLYTDDTSAYNRTDREHETVKHSAAEYVRYLEGETVYTNGVESFWSMLKRAHQGVSQGRWSGATAERQESIE